MNEILTSQLNKTEQPDTAPAQQTTTSAAKQPVVNFSTACVITIGAFATVCVLKGYTINLHIDKIGLDFSACPSVFGLPKAA